MSDLIHRADLFNELSNLDDKADIFNAINNAPTVDAVEAVRCKNCQKCSYDEEWKAYVAKPGCPLKPIGFGCALIEPDGYCSRGVKKGGRKRKNEETSQGTASPSNRPERPGRVCQTAPGYS